MTVFLSAILPVGVIMVIGWIAQRTLSVEFQSLSLITVYILAPALVADSLYRTTVSSSSTVKLFLAFSLISLVLYLVVWIIGVILNLSPVLQKSLVATTLFPNNGNLGISLITFALGEAGLERAIIYLIASSILMFGFGPALLKGKGWGFGLNLTLKLPLFWAIIFGLSLRFARITLPFNLDQGIFLLGQASIPIALLILGMQLATTPFQLQGKEFLGLWLRIGLAPLIALAMGALFKLEALDLQVLVLQTAMPTAVNTIVLVTEFGGDPGWVARVIVVSTLGSFLTLPLILSFFS